MRQKTATKILPSRGFIHQLPSLGNVSRSHVPAIINNRRWPFSTIRQVTIFRNNALPETRWGAANKRIRGRAAAGLCVAATSRVGTGWSRGKRELFYLQAKPSQALVYSPPTRRTGKELILRTASSKPWIQPSEDTHGVKKSSSIAAPNFKRRFSLISDARMKYICIFLPHSL